MSVISMTVSTSIQASDDYKDAMNNDFTVGGNYILTPRMELQTSYLSHNTIESYQQLSNGALRVTLNYTW